MTTLLRALSGVVLAGAIALMATAPVRADASTPIEIVSTSTFTAERLLNSPDYTRLRAMTKDAKGVLIFPSLLKAGFIFGAEGGSGVLLTKDADGVWSYPAFYTMATASFGFQIGFQDAEAIFVIMTASSLDAVLNNNVKLGIDVSIAVGPVGQGIEGSTTTSFGGDIAAFSRTRGLFGGGAFEGAVVIERGDWNSAYYGDAGANARAIVMERSFTNTDADKLRAALVIE
jgi:lipid-binding SYLF domain-containing protein